MSDINWVGVGISVFLTIIIVYVVPMTIIIPIMEFNFPSEAKCNNLIDVGYSINGNVTMMYTPNETDWCTRNETGWHLNITRWNNVTWI